MSARIRRDAKAHNEWFTMSVREFNSVRECRVLVHALARLHPIGHVFARRVEWFCVCET